MLVRHPLTATITAVTTALTCFGLSISAASAQQGFEPRLVTQAETLIERGLKDRVGYEVTESLTTEVGPRLAGSAAEAQAREWAVAKLRSMGFKNVRVEPFEVTHWVRGYESAQIISPFPQPLKITALGGSVGTGDQGVTGEVVRFKSLGDLAAAPMTGYEGKIIFVDEWMTRTQDGSGYGVAVQKRSGAANEAGKRGAVAAMIRSVGTDHHRFPHTGQMRYADDVPQVPIVALSAPDADQVKRALERGKVTVSLNLDVQTLGKAPSGNVIAEIPGRTDEIVLIGAHLDSWDLGTGALDDGAGVGIVVGAANLIQKMGIKPKRTIRIVLYGAEEIGLVGGYAYAQAHVDDLDKHFVASESDFGAGKVWRLRTKFGEDKLGYADAFVQVLDDLGIAKSTNTASGGPDIGPISRLGVPAVDLDQNGLDYFDYHHTADDTFDKIDPDDFAQNVAAWAGFVWLAANMDGSLRAEAETASQ